MKFIVILFLNALFFVSCGKSDPMAQIENLEGYWEITAVTLADGSVKKFSINTLVDYIQVTGDSGVRAKVAPKLDGTFSAANTQEKFSIKIENDSLRLYYKTPYAVWKETVIEAKDSTLIMLNKDRKKYTYKRFKKLDFSK